MYNAILYTIQGVVRSEHFDIYKEWSKENKKLSLHGEFVLYTKPLLFTDKP